MQNKHGKLTVKDFLTSKRYYAIPSEFRYFNSYHDLAGHIYVAHNVVEKNMIQTMSPQLNLSINYSHLEKLAQVCLMGLVWHLKDPNSESIEFEISIIEREFQTILETHGLFKSTKSMLSVLDEEILEFKIAMQKYKEEQSSPFEENIAIWREVIQIAAVSMLGAFSVLHNSFEDTDRKFEIWLHEGI